MAIVGRKTSTQAMVLYAGANQLTGPAYSAKKSFIIVGDLTNEVNKASRPGPRDDNCRCLWLQRDTKSWLSRVVTVAQCTERFLPILDDLDSNPVKGNFL